MKLKICVLSVFLFYASSLLAQISPTPVINNEVRDNSSIRMREVELERFKRDSKKVKIDQPTKAQTVKFAEIKGDFENIQKLQSEIVKTYTTGNRINFKKISEAAAEISRRAARLDSNLFFQKSAKPKKDKKVEEPGEKNLKDLIIELDNEIGIFVTSPIFTNNKLVDSKVSGKSQDELEKIIQLSVRLSVEAKKFI